MTKPLNIIFSGTPSLSADMLQVLVNSRHNISLVLTQPDRPKGRGKKIAKSAVKELALANNIEVLQPLSLRKDKECVEYIKSLNADVMVVLAYGLILPQDVLDIPKYGCINIHTSILPKYRGAAPIQRAIQNGDSHTGVTIMQMDKGLDTGDILQVEEFLILDNDTSLSIFDKSVEASKTAIINVLDDIQNIKRIKQDDFQATYAEKITKEDGRISWDLNAFEISCLVRAFIPWPNAFFEIDEQNVKVGAFEIISQENSQAESGEVIAVSKDGFDIQTSKDIFRIKELQFPNKKMLKIADILNGRDLSKFIGNILK